MRVYAPVFISFKLMCIAVQESERDVEDVAY